MADTLCSAPYEDPGGEYADLWSEKMVTARKDHSCIEACGGKVKAGEEYGRASYLYDGSWDSIARCHSCVILAEMVGTVHGECAQWGHLDEYIEMVNDDRRYKHKKLFPSPANHRKTWEATNG